MYIICYCMFVIFFFFKQKTAYEMRISDWSSDVCSSDPHSPETSLGTYVACCSADPLAMIAAIAPAVSPGYIAKARLAEIRYSSNAVFTTCEIGRASCRERVCQYV